MLFVRVVVFVVAGAGDELELWDGLYSRGVVWTRARGGGYASLSLFGSHLVPLAFRVN